MPPVVPPGPVDGAGLRVPIIAGVPRRRTRRRSTPTPAQIHRLLNRTAREVRLARREHAELLRRLAREAEERQREAEERQREAEARAAAAATREEEREAEAAAREEQRRLEAAARDEQRRAEAAAQDELRRQEQAKRDALLEKRLAKMAGYADNQWGRLMEALVEGDLVDLLRAAGVPIIDVSARLRAAKRGEWREWDLVAWGETDVVVVEVETTLTRKEIPRFLKQMTEFRAWRPDYAYGTLRGGLAYLTATAEVAREAEEAGLYLIRAAGSSAKIVNGEGFRPRLF